MIPLTAAALVPPSGRLAIRTLGCRLFHETAAKTAAIDAALMCNILALMVESRSQVGAVTKVKHAL